MGKRPLRRIDLTKTRADGQIACWFVNTAWHMTAINTSAERVNKGRRMLCHATDGQSNGFDAHHLTPCFTACKATGEMRRRSPPRQVLLQSLSCPDHDTDLPSALPTNERRPRLNAHGIHSGGRTQHTQWEHWVALLHHLVRLTMNSMEAGWCEQGESKMVSRASLTGRQLVTPASSRGKNPPPTPAQRVSAQFHGCRRTSDH